MLCLSAPQSKIASGIISLYAKTNLEPQKKETLARSWLFEAHDNQRRPRCAETAPRKRSQKTHCCEESVVLEFLKDTFAEEKSGILDSMLPRKNRLNFRLGQHRAILKTGQKYYGRFLEAAFDHKGTIFQAGVLVPKRHITHSSARNTLRRRILNAIPDRLKREDNLRLAIRIISEQAIHITEAEILDFFENLIEEIGV